MEHKQQPHIVRLSAELKEDGFIYQEIKMQGCNNFLETALVHIFLTIYESHPDCFFKVMDRFMETALDKELT